MGPKGRLGAREARDSVWDPRFGLDASQVNFFVVRIYSPAPLPQNVTENRFFVTAAGTQLAR